MTSNIVQNMLLPEEKPFQGEEGLCRKGQLQEVRKNLPPDQSVNLQVCSFLSLHMLFLARVRMDCVYVCSMCALSFSMPLIYKHNVCINI